MYNIDILCKKSLKIPKE